MSKEVLYGGIPYSSKHMLCGSLGIADSSLNANLNRGLSFEEAVSRTMSHKGRKGNKFIPINVDGKEFECIADVARKFNIGDKAIVRVQKNGKLSLDDIEGIKSRVHKEIIFEGEKYPNLVKLAKVFNLNYVTVKTRLSSGWTLKEAIRGRNYRKPYAHLHDFNKSPLNYNGKDYYSFKSIADKFNLTYQTFLKRLRLGWTLNEAINGKNNTIG